MKVIVNEWPNEDAEFPEFSDIYEVGDAIVYALIRYVKDGVADQSIRSGIKRIKANWFDLGYNEGDISQRDHLAGLFVLAYGKVCDHNIINNVKARFSTTYTTSLTAEELRSILLK
jgi:hypothetical protein